MEGLIDDDFGMGMGGDDFGTEIFTSLGDQETSYKLPELKKMPFVAHAIFRPSASTAKLCAALNHLIAAAEAQNVRIVLQTWRSTKQQSEEHFNDQSKSLSVVRFPPSGQSTASFTRAQKSSTEPGQVGYIRVCTTRSTVTTYQMEFDATIPCTFADFKTSRMENGTRVQTPVWTVPVGLGPAVEVEASSFVSMFSSMINDAHGKGAQNCYMKILESNIEMGFEYREKQTVNGPTGFVCTEIANSEQHCLPFSSHNDVEGSLQSEFRAHTVDQPIDRTGGLSLDLNQDQIAKWFSALKTPNVKANSSDVHAKMRFDFSFVPPTDWREKLRWKSELVLGHSDAAPDFCGFVAHTLVAVANASHVIHTSNLSSPYQSNDDFKTIPQSAYDHFLDFFELRLSRDILASDYAEEWSDWSRQHMKLQQSRTGENAKDVTDFYFARGKMERVLASCRFDMARVRVELPRGVSESAKNSLVFKVVFDDAPPSAAASGQRSDSSAMDVTPNNNSANNAYERKQPFASTANGSSLIKHVSPYATTPSTMVVTLHNLHLSSVADALKSSFGEGRGNPILRDMIVRRNAIDSGDGEGDVQYILPENIVFEQSIDRYFEQE